MQYSVGLITLTPLRKKAADVNVSNTVSAIDALLINRRFAGLITSFAAGDWVFGQTGGILTNDTVILQNTDATKGLLALKTGDINGSLNPGVASKLKPDVAIHPQGRLVREDLQSFDLPVFPEEAIQLGAMSMVLYYPETYLEVTDLHSNLENFVYGIDRGEIRIAWCSLQGETFDKERPLFHIRGRIKQGTPADVTLAFEPGLECELNDRNGAAIPPSVLFMPELVLAGSMNSFVVPNPEEFYLGANYPNPFTHITELPYYLPEQSQVRISVMNLLGEEIALVYEGLQARGTYRLSLDASNIAPGIYLYRMTATTGNRAFDKSRNLVISR
jgi:hypothetical protein